MIGLYPEMLADAQKKISELLAVVVKKRKLAGDPGYKNITKLVDLENEIDYYYIGYPKKKELIFSMQIKRVDEQEYPLIYPQVIIDFNTPVV